MGQTVFTGPVAAGDQGPGTPTPNQGFVDLNQQVALPQNGVGTTDRALYMPLGSILEYFTVDVLTAYNSGTSATLSIGQTVGGTEYVTSVALTAAGRINVTYTAAQLAAMNSVTLTGAAAPTPALVNFRVTTVGATSAGFAVVTLNYYQVTSSYS